MSSMAVFHGSRDPGVFVRVVGAGKHVAGNAMVTHPRKSGRIGPSAKCMQTDLLLTDRLKLRFVAALVAWFCIEVSRVELGKPAQL